MAKTKFQKSLIFQLLFFIMLQINMLIFITLKLLQMKPSKIINFLFYEKTIILNKKNDQKYIQDNITYENYIYIFTSLKIALSKRVFL